MYFIVYLDVYLLYLADFVKTAVLTRLNEETALHIIYPKRCTNFSSLQYACVDELDKWRKDYIKAMSALKELLDIAEAKLNVPVQVSFLNIRAFLQDVEVRKSNCQFLSSCYWQKYITINTRDCRCFS